MSKTTGYIDENGSFRLLIAFDPQNSNDMKQMLNVLRDEESATVKTYDSESVEVICRPDCFSDYGL